MTKTRIKICGLMRPQDAALASRLGADAAGMIFHPPAKRNISPEQAQEIVGALGTYVTPVGVFMDDSTTRIITIAQMVGLRVVQLHGHETPPQVEELNRNNLKVLKALQVDETLPQELLRWRGVKGLSGIVLDTAGVSGGTGVANDFTAILVHHNSGCFNNLGPIIVAGGLTPENVGQVVRLLRPWAVDVSSGVEASLGVKDEQMVRRFVEEVSAAYGVSLSEWLSVRPEWVC
jgi:phosphoribosylanthranilate isomerase